MLSMWYKFLCILCNVTHLAKEDILTATHRRSGTCLTIHFCAASFVAKNTMVLPHGWSCVHHFTHMIAKNSNVRNTFTNKITEYILHLMIPVAFLSAYTLQNLLWPIEAKLTKWQIIQNWRFLEHFLLWYLPQNQSNRFKGIAIVVIHSVNFEIF